MPRQFDRKRKIFSTNGAGTLHHPYAKKVGIKPIPYATKKLTHNYLHVKPKAIQLLEQHTGNKSFESQVKNLDTTQKSTNRKRTRFINSKCKISASQDFVKKMKGLGIWLSG